MNNCTESTIFPSVLYTCPELIIFIGTSCFFTEIITSLNPLSSELYRRCYKNGTCRLECFGSEMLVAYCMFQLECCLKGNPEP
ncbi:hypothetical protein FD755_019724 [Muntiacus reevesi]|uniref:Beta-defensin n=1 Tax=Muntiacus reevesi TaxID=9886 RepID=A0A5N3X3C3_MUNRE|nr:hypothetical protein FD755_019724 [Muntiacus reevesi]